jgi:hypothetical protein
LLFGSNGVFELPIDVVHEVTELAHGYTSNARGTRQLRTGSAGGLGRPRVSCEWEAVQGCTHTTKARVS